MKVSSVGKSFSPKEITAMRSRHYKFPDLELSPDDIVTLRLLLDHVTPNAGHSSIPERQRQIELIQKIMGKAVEQK